MALVATIVALAVPAPTIATPARSCREKPACSRRVTRKRWRKTVRPWNAKLDRMNRCEATGRWFIATGNGYYGGLQFDLRTWASVGGRGMPHHASELEQKYRAVLLIKRRGLAPWPVCGGS